jgi:hypothetical protein
VVALPVVMIGGGIYALRSLSDHSPLTSHTDEYERGQMTDLPRALFTNWPSAMFAEAA